MFRHVFDTLNVLKLCDSLNTTVYMIQSDLEKKESKLSIPFGNQVYFTK